MANAFKWQQLTNLKHLTVKSFDVCNLLWDRLYINHKHLIPQQWLLPTNLEANKLEPQKNSRWLLHATQLCDNISQSQNSCLCQQHDTSCRLRCSVLGPTQLLKPICWIILSWFYKITQQHAQWCCTRHLYQHSKCCSFCSQS